MLRAEGVGVMVASPILIGWVVIFIGRYQKYVFCFITGEDPKYVYVTDL